MMKMKMKVICGAPIDNLANVQLVHKGFEDEMISDLHCTPTGRSVLLFKKWRREEEACSGDVYLFDPKKSDRKAIPLSRYYLTGFVLDREDLQNSSLSLAFPRFSATHPKDNTSEVLISMEGKFRLYRKRQFRRNLVVAFAVLVLLMRVLPEYGLLEGSIAYVMSVFVLVFASVVKEYFAGTSVEQVTSKLTS